MTRFAALRDREAINCSVPLSNIDAPTARLLIVHFSDVHLRLHDRDNNPSLRRVGELVGAIRSVDADPNKTCVIVISGDSAFAGKTEEYQLAQSLFQGVRTRLLAAKLAHDVIFIVVPGNHDCDFALNTVLRDLAIRNISQMPLDASILEQCGVVQKAYRDYEAQLLGLPTALPLWLHRTVPIPVGEKTVRFELFNTSWLSQLHEKPAELCLPPAALQTPTEAADLVVTVFHHPYNWLGIVNSREFRGHVETSSDLILTGHEHVQTSSRKENLGAGNIEYIEAGALQETDFPLESAFNVLLIDLNRREQRLHIFKWDSHLYTETQVPVWQSLIRNGVRTRHEYQFSAPFQQVLIDAGANFTHPRKEKLALTDFFVWPTLRKLSDRASTVRVSSTRTAVETDTLRGRAVQEQLLLENRWLLYGPDKAGKTALAKRLCALYYDHQLVPVLLDGETLKSSNPDRVREAIRAAFAAQYASPGVTEFEQLPRERKVFVIDNFHHSLLNEQARGSLLTTLWDLAGKVVLFTGESPGATQLLGGALSVATLAEYQQAELLEFGYQLRHELVRKWQTLGRDETVSPVEVNRQIHLTERILDDVLGTNFVPAYPLFVLALLQQAEAAVPGMTTHLGSYSHFYEIIIKSNLANTVSKAVGYDTKLTFLSVLAFFLYERGTDRLISPQELEQVYRHYRATYRDPVEYDELVKDLQHSSILQLQHNHYRFKYEHLYHYFLASYIATVLQEDHNAVETKELIIRICGSLYLDDHARIMIFLAHLSKNAFILESVLGVAQQIFTEIPACDLETNMDHLVQRGTLTYVPSDPEVNQRAALERRDELEVQLAKQVPASSQVAPASMQPVLEPRDLDLIAQFNFAFKTIDVVGQLLKSFAGSMKGAPKERLVKEAFNLGMRSLNFLLEAIHDENDELAQFMFERFVNHWEENHPGVKIPSEELKRQERRAYAAITWLAEMTAFSHLKKLSLSLGTERLTDTFSDVIGANPSTAFRLLDVAVKLDLYRGFPELDIERLGRDLRKKSFPLTLLKMLALEHFHLYRVEQPVVQKVCAVLNIPIKQGTITTLASSERKRFAED